MRTKLAVLLPVAALYFGCDGDEQAEVSRGLKIFVTARAHVPNFADDPLLAGANAIAKADAFCNADPAKPDGATYKALLVDGVLRDAPSRTDWVLQPNTRYYRTRGDVLIGTTTDAALLPAHWAPLAAPIGDPPRNGGQPTWAWTGIGSAADFSAGEHCNGWSDEPDPPGTMSSGPSASFGNTGASDGTAFFVMNASCTYGAFRLYCVQQP